MALFQKKEKEVYERIPSLIGNGDDYHVYDMTWTDRLAAFAIGAGIGGVVIYVFFRSVVVTLLAAVIAGIFAQGIYRNYKLEKRRKNLLLQFRDLMEALTSSYAVGKNSLDSFTDALSDMEQIYGEQSDIYAELAIIVGGMSNNINLEDLLTNFAMRSGLDDVMSFADVFRVALRQGANINNIIASTRDIIIDKMEIEMEIDSILSGNKSELSIMMIMPLVVLLSMGGLGSDMTAVNNSPINIIIKLVVLGMFFLAYKLGKKFTTIKI